MQSGAGGGRRIKIIYATLILLISLLSPSLYPKTAKADTSYAQTIYVSANGSDTTGAGSASAPYQTVQKAFSSVNQNNSCIYIDAPGTYAIPGGLESLFSSAYGITYKVNPNYYGQVKFNLMTTESNINVTSARTSFIGIVFYLSNNGADNFGRFYEYFFNGATVNMAFYNCVFDKGPITPSGSLFAFGNTNVGCNVAYFALKNCVIMSPSLSENDVCTDALPPNASSRIVNNAFVANIKYVWAYYYQYGNQYPLNSVSLSPYNLTGVIIGAGYQVTSSGWLNTGTGTNPDGSQANIGTYGGEYDWSTIPSVPTGLKADGITSSSVHLSWQSANGATSYTIYENGHRIAAVSGTTYTVTGLQPSTNYSFQVAGANIGSQSALSDAVNVTTLAQVPSSPGGLSAGSVTPTSFIVYWLKTSNTDSYNVYLDGTLIASVSQPLLGNPSYSFSGLQQGSTHTVTVTAVNQVGESLPSTPLIVHTTVPAPVLHVTVDSHNLKLSWQGISGSDSYLVMVNGSQAASVTGNEYTLTERPGNYKLQLIEVNNGKQYPSNIVYSTVSALTVPGAANMASGLLGNLGVTLVSMGGLLALALALKASPLVITAAKFIFRR